MKFFLERVAGDLRSRFGNDLSRTAVIFPNKRAGLFLNSYLAAGEGGAMRDEPVWAPRYQTISDLFCSLSDKVVADPIEAVCRLHRLYGRLTGSAVTLDYFYGWGERLLADFGDVDKNMADARSLFRDIRDYGALEDFDLLDEEQREQLQRFSSDFGQEKLTRVRENFYKLWRVMYDLYDGLRRELAQEGKAYEGQLFREVAEGLQAGRIALPADVEHVALVGFNVIDRVEHLLFEKLQEAGLALFYWDYDTYYARPDGTAKNEAGLFMQQNLRDFPSALGVDGYDNFLQHREGRSIEYASAPTELAAAQSVAEWLRDPQNFNPREARRTAIVLCNENLLQPVLHALPETVGDVNVTKGFPLGHTPAFACVVKFAEEMQQAHDRQVAAGGRGAAAWPEGAACEAALLDLQERVKEEASRMQGLSAGDALLHDLYTESYFQVYTAVARFLPLVRNGLLSVQLPMLLKLLRQTLRKANVPFHGEPAVGLQIMGVLETRCLDFDHILMLSVGEGILPQRAGEASFIPFLLRKLHRLTTPDRQISVYAYYFYRLLSRAKRVRLTYNISTEGTQRGEMSRFMRALLVEADSKLHIRHLSLEAAHRTFTQLSPKAAEEHADFLERVKKEGLSPSALKIYFKCPLQFYYKYVKRLKTPQEQDGIINANDFGTIFHKAAEIVFSREMEGAEREVSPARLSRFVKERGEVGLYQLVGEAFEEVNAELRGKGDPVIPYSQIAHQALVSYLRLLLTYEAGGRGLPAPALSMRRIATEQRSEMTLLVPYGEEKIPVRLYGNLDRREEATLADGSECLRIIDYKTGKRPEKYKVKDLDALFEDCKDYPENPLQALIYSLMWVGEGKPVVPMLYYIPSLSTRDFTPYIYIDGEAVTDFRSLSEDFREKLVEKLSILINPANDFNPTKTVEHCKHCPYHLLCGR